MHIILASEALAVDYTSTCLIELLLGDPHGMERGQSGMDRTAEPTGVLAFIILNDLGAMVRWNQSIHLAPETLRDVGEQGATACQEDVLEEVTSDCFVAFHN